MNTTPIRAHMIAADYIRELIRPYTTTEQVERLTNTDGIWRKTRANHTVTHPPLIQQLERAVTTSTVTADDTTRTIPRSKPAARLDALVVLQRIDKQSQRIADELALPRHPLDIRLSRISGELGNERHRVIAGWWTSARIVTGWESPPYSPTNIPCPIEECEQRGGLRIRLSESIAYCVECGTHWDTTEIGLLGQWVEWASEHLHGPRHWTVDPDGFPVECLECLTTRDAMAERQIARAAIAQTKTPRRAG